MSREEARMDREHRWMTTEEIAVQMGVSPSTVRRWLANKRLHGRRIGKRWLVPPQDQVELTPQEAAAMLRVAPDTVRRWLAEGKVPGRQVGRRWQIPRDEMIALVERS
jgi:excisionase family DNA binding protein